VIAMIDLIKADKLTPSSPFDELSSDELALLPLSRISPEGRDFVKGLLHPFIGRRLSAASIRQHPYFAETNWAAVRAPHGTADVHCDSAMSCANPGRLERAFIKLKNPNTSMHAEL